MHLKPPQRVEQRLRELLADAGLPAPDETAHLSRAVTFVWYEKNRLVLVDLESPAELSGVA